MEYWIVDPDARTLERLVLRDGRLLMVETRAGAAAFAPPSFPGSSVPVDVAGRRQSAVMFP